MARTSRPPQQPDLRSKFEGVGSAFVPTRASVRRAVRALQAALNERRKSILEEGVVPFHNLYTTYVVLMLTYASAYRSVSDPFWLDADVDPTSGLVGISDKGKSDFYSSRGVVLPKICFVQLEHYRRHRERISEMAALLDNRLHQSMSAAIGRRVTRRRDSVARLRRDVLPEFFYLPLDPRRNRRGWIHVTPTELHKRLRKSLPPPLNGNRHYQPSELRLHGCPEDIIFAFMGHWHQGQEPWGRFGCLSMRTYKAVLLRHTERTLHEDGWIALRGIDG